MTNTHHLQKQISPNRPPFSLVGLWVILRSPKTFIASTIALISVLLAAIIIPQQPADFGAPGEFVVWVSNLPLFYQRAFQWFNVPGLFRIYHSVWLWLPAAWLTLVSLILLADTLPATWQRLQNKGDVLLQPMPHPLSTVQHKTIRLMAPQSAAESTATAPALAELKENLAAQGFELLPTADEQSLVAVQSRWFWSGPTLAALGVILIVLGGVVQNIWGAVDQTLLAPEVKTEARFAGQLLKVNRFTPVTGTDGKLLGGAIELATNSGRTVTWQLYKPYRLNGWWVIPTKVQPVAQVSFTEGETTEQSTLIFEDPNRPLTFAHSPRNLSLELRYIATEAGPDYQLRITNVTDPAFANAEVIQQGAMFIIPNLNITGQVIIHNKVLLRAYKLPGLPALLLGSIILLLALVQLPLPRPGIVRLTGVTKGRGSKIEAEVETLGYSLLLEKTINNTLTLAAEDKPDEQRNE